ncbi:hypothetical protein CK203_074610 [Vitis vinifera]|uniref:Uncharacterized protein n=1 Tax=Vitis vinifera TaxID=29760 RepID=A0A438DWD0_VITVI|nr:hypothetical protein CK203_074610 [Vitis vinifera]
MHRGGERKGWFRVKCKSFGIIVEVVKGKVIGKVLERSRESEGRRKYLQELQSNVAGRFSLCSMAAGRFTLLFSKCKGYPGGWSTLAKKLRSLGVSSNNKVEEAFTKKGALMLLWA